MNKSIVIDASNNCMLKCVMCERTYMLKKLKRKPPGGNLTVQQFKKIADYYTDWIEFCGQRGDVSLNPHLPEFLSITRERKITTKINTAAGYRNKEWYIECFKANPNAIWVFGIDGLPHQSHNYRINQDGEKLFDIMCESTQYLNQRPIWQYIVFNFNEDSIEEAKQLAIDKGINLEIHISARWRGKDPLLPRNKKYAKASISQMF